MKKLLYVLVAVIMLVSSFALVAFADEPAATLTITAVSKNSITFKYTGAKSGNNNWIAIYKKDTVVTPEDHETPSDFYIYIADGDGEYTLNFADCVYTKYTSDTWETGTGNRWRNVEEEYLTGNLEDYKVLWLAGASWYETLVESPLAVTASDSPETSDSALAVAIVAIAAAGAVVLAKKKH